MKKQEQYTISLYKLGLCLIYHFTEKAITIIVSYYDYR